MIQFSLGRLISRLYRASAIFIVCSLAFGPPLTAGAQTSQLDEIEEEVSRIRELEILVPIDVAYLSREDFEKQSAVDFELNNPVEDIARDQRTMIAFGLIDPGTDLSELYVGLFGGAVEGYYDAESGALVLIDDGEGNPGELSVYEEFVLAHEIGHALDDQHFDLIAGPFDTSNATDDVALGANALAEGNAELTRFRYVEANPAFARDLNKVFNEMEESGKDPYEGFPPFIVNLLLFPYSNGYEFVDWLHDEGGYELVDEAFEAPPTTTEQVLHPEKYLEGEVGKDISVIDLAPILGGDWTDTDENAFGEFIISQFLMTENVDDDDAGGAAEGWNGDLYKVAGSGEQSAIVWQSSWDSDDDAEEFAEITSKREADRLGEDAEEDDGTYTIAGETAVIMIHVDGDSVTYVMAPDEAGAQSLLDAQLAAR